MALLLYIFAFCSGFAALVYQVAWSRMLSLSFGSTTLAVSAVVAGFMGGMGIGAWLYHRVGDRAAIPLRAYALLEIGIAISTAGFTLLFLPLPQLFASVAGGLEGAFAINLFRITTAFVLLVVPAALMGATYPALCQALIHSATDVDRRLGWIYGINTLGAALGALVAGFYMMEAVGSLGSVALANGINLTVGVVALLAARGSAGRKSAEAPSPDDESLPSDLPTWIAGVVLVGSGFATLGYEIVWFRALHYLMGNGTYVLSSALVIFLLGLGIGGILYRVAVRFGKPEWNLGLCQLVIAVLALGAMLSEQWILVHPEINDRINVFRATVDVKDWQTRVGLGFMAATAIMLPATVWMGLSFPLASRLFLGSVRNLSSRVGLAYLLSNLGSIAGAIFAAIWILPNLGSVGGTKLLASVNVMLGLLILVRAPSRALRAAALAIIVIAAALALVLPPRLHFVSFAVDENLKQMRLLFEEEGDLGTVQVLTRIGKPDAFGMAIDGVIIGATEAWKPRLHSKQLILAHLAMVLDRDIRHTLNLGLASGSTVKTLSRFPWVETLDVVEINPSVVSAGSFFFDTTVLADPRTTLHVEDAIHFLLRTDRTYDLIISDAKQDARFGGNARILSKEMYEYALDRLSECGLFIQFLPMSGSPEYMNLILRTFVSVFPESEFFIESPMYLISVGSRCPIGGREQPTRDELIRAGVAAEIERHYMPDASQLASVWVASGDEMAAFLGDGPINEWDRLPVEFMAYRLPRFRVSQSAEILREFLEARDLAPDHHPDVERDLYRPALLELLRAYMDLFDSDVASARRRVEAVLEQHPDLPLARKAEQGTRFGRATEAE